MAAQGLGFPSGKLIMVTLSDSLQWHFVPRLFSSEARLNQPHDTNLRLEECIEGETLVFGGTWDTCIQSL